MSRKPSAETTSAWARLVRVMFYTPGFLALLLINAGLSYRNTHQLSKDARWVAHTHEVLGQTSEVLRTLVDAETSYRGLVVTGKDDVIIRVEDSRSMADSIPGCRFVEVPDSGHLSNLENPNEFNRVLVDFLKQSDSE